MSDSKIVPFPVGSKPTNQAVESLLEICGLLEDAQLLTLDINLIAANPHSEGCRSMANSKITDALIIAECWLGEERYDLEHCNERP